MQKRLLALAGIVVVVGLSSASPALAHRGHGSCAGGAQTFTVPLAQSGQAGVVISEVAQAGEAGETSAALHGAGCEPRP